MMKKVEENKAVVVAATQPSRARRKFDPAFKREAVALWLNSGKSAPQMAAELGIDENRLYAWRRRYGLTSLSPQGETSELEVLRRENALLRQQRDILKKTLGILSEGPNNATSGSTH